MLRYFVPAVFLASAASGQQIEPVSGEIQPVNGFHEDVSGQVTIGMQDDGLALEMMVQGISPGMHLAHIHGFPTDSPAEAACPDQTADANGDGYVDLIETRDAAGVTMIPLTGDPVSLEIHSETYPSASESGEVRYRATVDADDLTGAVEAEFGTPLALDRRIVFLHGAPADADLPDSVQSLEGVPAQVTIPIACAEL